MLAFAIILFLIGLAFFSFAIAMLSDGEEIGGLVILLALSVLGASIAMFYLNVRSNASEKALMLLSKTNAITLNVDKNGNTTFTLKDSSYIDVYNYLNSNR